MVKYCVSHGFGNQLFQYWMARIIAGRFGFKLQFDKYYLDGKGRPLALSLLNLPLILSGKQAPEPVQKVEHKSGCLFDFDSLDPSRAVCVNPDGHSTFEWYPYFRKDKDEIRRVMREHIKRVNVAPKTLAIHLRLGDMARTRRIPSAAFYEKAVDEWKPRHIVVVTDEPDNPFAQYLVWRYKARVVSERVLEDFMLLVSCDAVVASDSTFSWWAAFISDAEVYHPWKRYKTQKDLTVDEGRYQHVEFEWDSFIHLYKKRKT